MKAELARLLIPFVLSGFLALLITPVVIWLAKRSDLVSQPREGRWHRNPTPLMGGVAIYLAVILPGMFFLDPLAFPLVGALWLSCTLIFFLGLADDVITLRPYTKLLGQIIAASLAVVLGLRFIAVPLPVLSIPLSILWIVGITNALNLLDNMDGLAAGIAFISAGFLSVHSFANSAPEVGALAALLAGAALGFLRYNFKPAKCFMGDCGSMFLGFTLASLAIMGTGTQVSNLLVTLMVPALILAVPIFDTTFVALMRTLKGRPITQGGKDHTSHRLVFLGLSEERSVLILYAISLVFGTIALFYSRRDITVITIFLVLAVVIVVLFGLLLGEVKVYEGGDEAVEARLRAEKQGGVVFTTFYLYKRRIVELLIDFVLICVSYYAAYLIRFGNLTSYYNVIIMDSLPWVIVFRLATFSAFGLYRGVWRFVGLTDLVSIFKAVSLGTLFIVLFATLAHRFESYSRSVFLIDWLLAMFLVAGSRLFIRVLLEYFSSMPNGGKKVLIMGAGDAGDFILREIRKNKDLDYYPVGFLDDDLRKVGGRMHGLPVLGTREDIPNLVQSKGVEEVIIAIPSAPETQIAGIRELCERSGVPYREVKKFLGIF